MSEEALASRIDEATEHMTRMELFKQASAYSKHYLIKLCENLCVSGMSSKTIPEILRALEDRSKTGGFTIQKLFPPQKTASELQTHGHINEQHSTGIYCCSMLVDVVACGALNVCDSHINHHPTAWVAQPVNIAGWDWCRWDTLHRLTVRCFV